MKIGKKKRRKANKKVKSGKYIDTPAGRFYYTITKDNLKDGKRVSAGYVDGKRVCRIKMYKVSKQIMDIFKETEVYREDGRPFELSDEIAYGMFHKRIWVYIKKKNLQSPEDKRIIIPDEKMAKIFGDKPFTMFALPDGFSRHSKRTSDFIRFLE